MAVCGINGGLERIPTPLQPLGAGLEITLVIGVALTPHLKQDVRDSHAGRIRHHLLNTRGAVHAVLVATHPEPTKVGERVGTNRLQQGTRGNRNSEERDSCSNAESPEDRSHDLFNRDMTSEGENADGRSRLTDFYRTTERQTIRISRVGRHRSSPVCGVPGPGCGPVNREIAS